VEICIILNFMMTEHKKTLRAEAGRVSSFAMILDNNFAAKKKALQQEQGLSFMHSG